MKKEVKLCDVCLKLEESRERIAKHSCLNCGKDLCGEHCFDCRISFPASCLYNESFDLAKMFICEKCLDSLKKVAKKYEKELSQGYLEMLLEKLKVN